MANLNYFLTRPKAKKSGIFFVFTYGAFEMRDGKKRYLPLKYYIDEQIEPSNWGNGKAKAVKTFPQHLEFNTNLKRIEDVVLSTYRKMKNDGLEINVTSLRNAFDKAIKNVRDFTPDVNTHLVAFTEDYINSIKKSNDVIMQYRQTLHNIVEYEKRRASKLKLLEIDMEFYHNFVEYLESLDYAPNTIGTRIKVLKLFLNEAFKKKLPVCLDFKLPEFKKPAEETSSVYLTEEELLKIYHLDLTDKRILQKTRDMFLVGAYTGFRFSDFSTLTKDNFCNGGTIQKRTIKTDQNVVVPIHPVVQSIIKRNNFEVPKVSYSTFNDALREVVKAAKIDYNVSYIETRGGKSETKVEPKWKLVGSHTARRSFATNAYLSGVPTISIMKMTGHKTESSFLKYIKITLEENAKNLQTHSFFTNNPDAVQQKPDNKKVARKRK
jgi:integrase